MRNKIEILNCDPKPSNYKKIDIPLGQSGCKYFLAHDSILPLTEEFPSLFENMVPDPSYPANTSQFFLSEYEGITFTIIFTDAMNPSSKKHYLYNVDLSTDYSSLTVEQQAIAKRIKDLAINSDNSLFHKLNQELEKEFGLNR